MHITALDKLYDAITRQQQQQHQLRRWLQ